LKVVSSNLEKPLTRIPSSERIILEKQPASENLILPLPVGRLSRIEPEGCINAVKVEQFRK